MLKIFHAPRTRSHRIVWLCEEMGVPYEIAEVKFGDPSPELRAVNPLKSLPTLQDGTVTMIELIADDALHHGKVRPNRSRTEIRRSASTRDICSFFSSAKPVWRCMAIRWWRLNSSLPRTSARIGPAST